MSTPLQSALGAGEGLSNRDRSDSVLAGTSSRWLGKGFGRTRCSSFSFTVQETVIKMHNSKYFIIQLYNIDWTCPSATD